MVTSTPGADRGSGQRCPRRSHAVVMPALCAPQMIVAPAVAHEEHARGVYAHTGRCGPKDGGVRFATATFPRDEDAGGHPIQTEKVDRVALPGGAIRDHADGQTGLPQGL